ncbi:MAG TPA: SpoIIE family protein phosphatase [Microvirga sp.]|jgi:serine phosphatase RsbU (regulator of sigma subunit)|nr:SpoIIE family protein phosphatase [Microvirga sp.]
MKIRNILLALIAFLGVALIATVALQIRGEVRDYREAQRLSASNAAREQLLRASAALADERTETYGHLLDPVRRPGLPPGVEAARGRVDAARGAAEALIRKDTDRLSHAGSSLQTLAHVDRELKGLRAQANAALAATDAAEGRRLAPRWFSEVTRILEEAQSLRLTLLQQERSPDPAARAEALLRYYSGLLAEAVARNHALLTQALAGRAGLGGAELDAASRNVGRAQLAWELMNEQLTAPLDPGVRASLTAARGQYATALSPLQETLLSSLRGRAWSSITADQWSDAAQAALQTITRLQEDLLRSSRERLDAQVSRALGSLVLWTALLLAGIAAVFASGLFVSRRIVFPLEALRRAMLRLAENDLATPLPRFARMDEIGEMSDALRVFKANAVRRHRLQEDKETLHARLTDTYRQLRADLDAAATIQAAMLPAPASIAGVRYRGLYRPSSVIAGDTYNVLKRNDGRIGFFQVDVAGHGAPAALISVASHHSLSQALLKQADGMPIEAVAAQINDDWPEDLPYFTMVLGEIDSRTGRGAIVQAGHPPPLLIGRDGAVRAIGEGGLPIGMFAGAQFDPVAFDVAEGDRLVLYSDGLVEAHSPSGEIFSEERLLELVQSRADAATETLLDAIDSAVRIWSGADTLEDDLSVLVLERLPRPVRGPALRADASRDRADAVG